MKVWKPQETNDNVEKTLEEFMIWRFRGDRIQ
jgi:hypothetical protein